MSVSSSARIERCAVYLPVADVAATGRYYHDVYGFSETYSAGTPPEFAICSREGCDIMLRRVADPSRIRPVESQGGTWDAFCWVSDVDALSDELTGNGATIVYPITLQPYGMREFAVRDPDGHVLGFGTRSS